MSYLKIDANDVLVDAKDLPVFCPNPIMPIWSSHPRVFLDMTAEGKAKCPYCGTVYGLKAGIAPAPH